VLFVRKNNEKWKIVDVLRYLFFCIKVHCWCRSYYVTVFCIEIRIQLLWNEVFCINLRIVTLADTVFLLFLDAFSKVPDTYVEQTAFGAAGKKIHFLQSSIEEWNQCYSQCCGAENISSGSAEPQIRVSAPAPARDIFI
jgi:hypothetical protein